MYICGNKIIKYNVYILITFGKYSSIIIRYININWVLLRCTFVLYNIKYKNTKHI